MVAPNYGAGNHNLHAPHTLNSLSGLVFISFTVFKTLYKSFLSQLLSPIQIIVKMSVPTLFSYVAFIYEEDLSLSMFYMF